MPSQILFVLFSAMAISMVIVPLMTKIAPALGLIDQPDARKVHDKPISRVGGIGIVIGALVPLLVWLPLDPLLNSYLIGGLILLIFGVWDDRQELGHYVKFSGQFAAVFAVVFYGDLSITQLPLLGDISLGRPIEITVTVIAMIGMINATNHSDGLDGLAGGETILSLIVIGFMAYLAGNTLAPLLAFACLGGILGFLRYNTHPAIVFMGDSGSQFLGFTLAFLVILLTQIIDPVLSPAVVLLLLGLPVIDIIAVFYLRASSGQNWFQASRNHIHHRILDLGFTHQQTVIIIYALQAVLVFSGYLLGYEFDWVILLIYFSFVAILFTVLTTAEKRHWRVKYDSEFGNEFGSDNSGTIAALRLVIRRTAMGFVAIVFPLSLVVGSGLVHAIPRDFAAIAAVMAVILFSGLFTRHKSTEWVIRAIIYATALFVAYLLQQSPPELITGIGLDRVTLIFYITLAVAIGIVIKFNPTVDFHTTPSDYLSLCMVFAISLFQMTDFFGKQFSLIVIQFLVVIYVCELLTRINTSRWNTLNIATLTTLSILAVRGF